VLVEVLLLALRRERQLPRALFTGTHLRRTFHYWPLCPFFRRVVFRAYRVVDWAPNHTSGKWAKWATAIWGAISAYWLFGCFTRSKKLRSSERQNIKLSPAGCGSKNRTLDHLALPVPVLVNRFQSTKNNVTVCLL
jgi:hypothetical protein